MNDLPLEEILSQAIQLDRSRRSAFLDEACGTDSAVRAEVESLLAIADRYPASGDWPDESDAGAPDQDALPEQIGRYPIVGSVGVGGMGMVYRARDPDLGREVALKRLPAGLDADPVNLARFRREARALARLQHPNIATVHSLEVASTGPFLTMELVPGQTLRELLADGPLPVKRALRIGVRIAAAMEAAHAEGIIHRDLKPANIQVGDADELKVLDFGLAKAIDEPLEADKTDMTNPVGQGPAGDVGALARATAEGGALTESGLVIGTPGYISPEQLQGQPVGPPADLWAFGCVLFECLAGTSPFGDDGSAARIPTRLRRTLAALELEPDWSLLPEDLPDRVGELLRSCLQIEPEARPDAASAHRTLADALNELTSQDLLAGPRSPGAGLSSRRTVVIVTCVLLLIAGVIAISRLWRSEPDRPPASTVRQLTHRCDVFVGDLTPDGGLVAYLNQTGHLVYLDLQTGQEHGALLTTGSGGDTVSVLGVQFPGLRWSPSGQELAVVGSTHPGTPTACTYVVPRGQHQAVPVGQEDFSGVVWSPDGSRLAGTRGIATAPTLCIVERQSGRLRDVPLDGTIRAAQVLAWSGTEHLYIRCVEKDSIWVVPASGGVPRAVLQAEFVYRVPGRNVICYYLNHEVRSAPLDERGFPAADYSVLADRVQGVASSFSVSRDERLVLYADRQMLEAWLGEKEEVMSGGYNYRWSRLVRGSMSTHSPRFSPDGLRVALVGSTVGDPSVQLIIQSLSDASRTVVARDRGISWLDWSPDGSEIVYRNARGMARVRIDGGAPRQIPGPLYPLYIRWLPDGRILYMDRKLGWSRNYRLLDPSTGDITWLPLDTERGTLYQFAMAPDGHSLAVAGNRGELDDVKVWLIDLADGAERLLYNGWAAPFDWSADGKWVYIVTEHPPEGLDRRRSQVLRVSADDAVVETVTDLPEPAFTWGHIDMSRDGRAIVCNQRRAGNDLWLISIDRTSN